MPGKLEVTIKFSELPTPVATTPQGVTLAIDCEPRVVKVSLRPKNWKKLNDAAAQYPMWVAALTGKMGPATKDGFELLDPALQVFEKKPKAPPVAA